MVFSFFGFGLSPPSPSHSLFILKIILVADITQRYTEVSFSPKGSRKVVVTINNKKAENTINSHSPSAEQIP
jgi:hypothetical protein